MMGPCIYFGIKNNQSMAGIVLVSSALTICFFNLDRFSYFKGAGFEAKLKDTVEKVIKPTLELQSDEIKVQVNEIKTQINEIEDKYWNEVEKINKEAREKNELVYNIELSETKIQMIDKIDEDIKKLQKFIEWYYEDVNKKRDDLVKKLEEKGVRFGVYDYNVSGGDFFTIALPNTNTSLEIRLKKLEIKILEEEVKKETKNKEKEIRLKKAQNQLKEMSEKECHVD